MTHPTHPKVCAILIAPAQGKPMQAVDTIEAEAQKGLVGDRYHSGRGYYSGDKVWDANVTFIAQEAFEAANRGTGPVVSPECLRRNIVTQNVELNDLLGRDFRIGSAIFRGTKLWPPCNYLDKMQASLDVLHRFAKSAGIGASVLTSGNFRTGDAIEILDQDSNS